MKMDHFGVLYVVATPIGNLADITLRAISTLQSVDYIAAEDTRHSLSLLKHFNIQKPLKSLHDHNERERLKDLLALLKKGFSVALISDAGTPLISDPGFHLVNKVRNEGIRVVPIPGACAAITALSAAGLPTDQFLFEGFLPKTHTARIKRLFALKNEPYTIVFYESPYRIVDLLKDLTENFGEDREALIARELTKIYETFKSGSLKELLQWVESDKNQARGEIVLIVKGITRHEKSQDEVELKKLLMILLDELPLKQAITLAVKITGLKKNNVYEIALTLKK